MSRKQSGRKANFPRPWQARVVWRGNCVFLGHFATKEEADAAEMEFRKKKGFEDMAAWRRGTIARGNTTKRLLAG
jgi:hypothetical protein